MCWGWSAISALTVNSHISDWGEDLCVDVWECVCVCVCVYVCVRACLCVCVCVWREKCWDDVTGVLQSTIYNSQCLRSNHLTVSWCLRVTSSHLNAVLLWSTHAPTSPGCGREATLWSPQTKQQASLCIPVTAQTGPLSSTAWWWRIWTSLTKESGAVRWVEDDWWWWIFFRSAEWN